MPVEFRLRRAKGQGLKAQFSAASLALQVPRKPLLPFVLPPCALLEQRCCPAREVPLRAAVGVPR